MLFLVLILLTAFNDDSEPIVDGTIPPALSGPEDSPRVLDDLRVWIAIALVLVAIAYAFPLANIVSRGGLFGPDIGPFPVVVETVASVLSTTDTGMYLEAPVETES